MKKRVVFIGNRPKVLDAILANKNLELLKAFVIEQPMIKDNISNNIERIKSVGEKEKVVDYLLNEDYDICLSAGCSYILPISSLPNEKLFINCHPSVLPFGKGIHPLNECFLSGRGKAGVTIHLLVDELDAGDILNQIEFDLTDEVDVSLLYGFIFDLEAELLSKTLSQIIENDMRYKAIAQIGEGTYYSREKKAREFMAEDVRIETFLNNVRAFSSKNLGIILRTSEEEFIVYSAERIVNPFILDRYKKISIGSIVFKTDEVTLIRLKDGMVKLNNYMSINRNIVKSKIGFIEG